MTQLDRHSQNILLWIYQIALVLSVLYLLLLLCIVLLPQLIPFSLISPFILPVQLFSRAPPPWLILHSVDTNTCVYTYSCSLNNVMPPSKSHRLFINNPNARHKKAPFKLLTKGIQDSLQIRVLPLLLVTWQKLNIKHYCWKTLCTLYPELRGSRLNPFPKLPCWWSSFIVSESDIEALSGCRQSTVLSSCDVYEWQQWASWQEFPKGTIVTLIT